ncbi:MAG: hypothetical protein U0984_08330 [Prosthecobacter sp.]|nr:hypothetical protein [Prosthecobacter sp.]
MRNSITKTILTKALWFLMLYVLGYLGIRFGGMQRWERDGQNYVTFPASPIALYYLYRPMSWLDAKLTGQRFHIGPHR